MVVLGARRGARFQPAVVPALATCPVPHPRGQRPFLGLPAAGGDLRPRDILTLKLHLQGRLAQLGERGVRNAEVVGSNPMPSTNASLRFSFFVVGSDRHSCRS